MRFIAGAAILALCTAWSGVVRPALAADPPASLPRFEVSGIMLQEDGRAWALIAEPQWTGGTARVFSPGAMIGPYRLVEIQRDHVVLQSAAGPPLKIPFSWRGGDTATAQIPAGARPPSRTAPPAVPPAPRAAAPARTDEEASRATDGAAAAAPRSAAAAPAASPAPVAATPPAQPRVNPAPRTALPTAYDQGRMEALRRERERMFRKDLSVEGFHAAPPSTGFVPAAPAGPAPAATPPAPTK